MVRCDTRRPGRSRPAAGRSTAPPCRPRPAPTASPSSPSRRAWLGRDRVVRRLGLRARLDVQQPAHRRGRVDRVARGDAVAQLAVVRPPELHSGVVARLLHRHGRLGPVRNGSTGLKVQVRQLEFARLAVLAPRAQVEARSCPSSIRQWSFSASGSEQFGVDRRCRSRPRHPARL